MNTIAIIGAGMTGLTCAAHLDPRRARVTVFEKSRGIGGRMATRRAPGGLEFDHGAQYLKAKSAAFRDFLEAATATGTAGPWQPRGGGPAAATDPPWMVGTPRMVSLLKPLTDGIDLRFEQRVGALTRGGDRLRLEFDSGAGSAAFDHVVVTVPAPQSAPLLAPEPDLAEAARGVTMTPCWTLMVAYAEPLAAPFDCLAPDDGPFAFVARNSARPGRPGTPETWVAQAGPAWSRRHLEAAKEEAGTLLAAALADTLGERLPAPVYTTAHRWRYALTERPLGEAFLADRARRLWVGGDWCLGGRAEHASESGRALAAAINRELGVTE